MRINGTVALVTGGASGLGRATVEALLSRGGAAIIADLPGGRGKLAAEQLGASASFVPTDIRQE